MNKFYTGVFLLVAVFTIVLDGCKKDVKSITQTPPVKNKTSQYSAQNAVDWMNLMRQIVKDQAVNPPQAARLFAYEGVALYEAVVDGMEGNKRLEGQLNGFSAGSIPADTSLLDYSVVANEALYNTVKLVVTNITPGSTALADTLHAQFLRTTPADSAVTARSIQRGILVANAISAWAAADNFSVTRGITAAYVLPSNAGHPEYWQPTDSNHKKPVEPYWGQIRPFALTAANQFDAAPAVQFSEDTSSSFYHQAIEVWNTVNNRTTEQSDIRLWWSDPTGTQTPAGHWIALLQYIIRDKNFKLDKAAELYAMTAITSADAFIACWDCKYRYNYLRPETYIHTYVPGQSGWSTGQFDITPPFPEYPSGHSVCSGACANILTTMLGTVAFTDSINYYSFGYTPRSFVSFNAAAQEAGISRLYGGIHYRNAIEAGLVMGAQVGSNVSARVKLR